MKRAARARAAGAVVAAAMAFGGTAVVVPGAAHADTGVVVPAPQAAVDRAADIVATGPDGVLMQEEGTAGYVWVSTANGQVTPEPALDGIPRSAFFGTSMPWDRVAYSTTDADGATQVVLRYLTDGSTSVVTLPDGYTHPQVANGFVVASRDTGSGYEYHILRIVGGTQQDLTVTLPAGATGEVSTPVLAAYETQFIVRWQQNGQAAYGIVDGLTGAVRALPVTGPASGFQMTSAWTLWFSRQGTVGVRTLPHTSTSGDPRITPLTTTSDSSDVHAFAVGDNIAWYEGPHGPLRLEPLQGNDTRRVVLTDAERGMQTPDGRLIVIGRAADGTRGLHDLVVNGNGVVFDGSLRTLAPVIHYSTTSAIGLDRGTLRFVNTLSGVTTLYGRDIGTQLTPVLGASLASYDDGAPGRFADGTDRGLARLTTDAVTGKDALVTGGVTVPLPSARGRILDVSPGYVLYAGVDGTQQVVDVAAGRVVRQMSGEAAALDYATLWTPGGTAGTVVATSLRTGATARTVDLGSGCTPTDLRSNGRLLYWACGPQHTAGVRDMSTGWTYPAPAGDDVLLGDHFMAAYEPGAHLLHLTRFVGDAAMALPNVLGVKPVTGDSRGVSWTLDRRSHKIAYVDTSDSVHVAAVNETDDSPLTVADQVVAAAFAAKAGAARWGAAWWLSEPAASWRLTLAARTTGAVVRTWTGGPTATSVAVSWDGRNASGALVPNGGYVWTLTATPADGMSGPVTTSGTVTVSGAGAAPRDWAGPAGPDGVGDLVTMTSSGSLAFQKGTGAGTFSGAVAAGGWPASDTVVPIGDLDGDHCDDVLVRLSTGTLRAYEPACGAAPTTTTPYRTIGSGWNTYQQITSPGDLDGDGRPDLLARDAKGDLYRYLGTSAGAFAPRVRIGYGWQIYSLIAGAQDLTGDGRGDVLARDTSGVLWRYDSDGRGGLKARVRIGAGWNTYNTVVGVGDFTGDGRSDLVARDAAGDLWRYTGTGHGTFAARVRIGGGWNVYRTLL